MAQKLKMISLGGLNEIGKNLYVYEYGGEIIVVECGIAFPDDEMLGVDLVIPDISYLIKHKNRIRGIIITHGHEDHIGALPYVLREINAPVYATKLTVGILTNKLEEHNLLSKTKLKVVSAGDKIKLGSFEVEFINVNHSIADAVALAITTPLGVVIHTGDFKLDTTPIQGEMMDITRFGELGKQGVLALFSESTNIERPGFSVSESRVGKSLEALFKDCSQRILVTTFASNVDRVQQVITFAWKYGRKVAISGRSMENIMGVAKNLGYLDIPADILVDINSIDKYPKNKICIITTGSQGEAMSALYRIAISGHKKIEIMPGDRVIISASPIPGNEKTVSRVINELFKKGAEVIYEKLAEIHASGHAHQEELRLMLALTKPKYFVPIHGEYRHLKAHAEMAKTMGVNPKNVFISDIGRVFEISEKGARLAGTVPSGKILVDGLGIGDVGSIVLRDRKHLAQDGLITVVVTLNGETGQLIAGPDIVTRGFIYVREAEDIMDELKVLATEAITANTNGGRIDWATIKNVIKSKLSNYLYQKTKRNPMILPIIMEI
ncbi:MAG: ribonuclease J [Clostridiales bacterium]|jgi:ribonuclease J|nr:ribonuclease J [Clostridiales bacterium]